MLNDYYLSDDLEDKFSYEKRKIETINFKCNARDRYFMNYYIAHSNYHNRTDWILDLIEKDLREKIELGIIKP